MDEQNNWGIVSELYQTPAFGYLINVAGPDQQNDLFSLYFVLQNGDTLRVTKKAQSHILIALKNEFCQLKVSDNHNPLL